MDDGIGERRGGLKRRLPGCFIIDGKYQKQSRFWRRGIGVWQVRGEVFLKNIRYKYFHFGYLI